MRRRALVLPGVIGALTMLLAAGCTSDSAQGEVDDTPDPAQAGDWMAMYEEYAAQQAESLRSRGVEVPTDAEFIRFIERDEFGPVHAECLREQGFEAESTPDGLAVGGPGVPDDQHDAHWQATYRCRIAYPVHPRFRVPMTDAQVRVIYDYFVDELVGCLEGEGYEVAPAPSWEAFLAQWRSADPHWDPHDSVRAPNEQEHIRIREECPQRPPLVDVYGEPPD